MFDAVLTQITRRYVDEKTTETLKSRGERSLIRGTCGSWIVRQQTDAECEASNERTKTQRDRRMFEQTKQKSPP